jgi:hypothetical protein
MSNFRRWLFAGTAIGRVRTKLVQASAPMFNPGRAWTFA